jgi:hypothetical protein
VVKLNRANFKCISLVIYFFFLFLPKVNAQLSLRDSLTDVQTKNNVVALFDSAFKGNVGLYNGGEYLYGGHNVKGFPYFKSNDILQGSVLYDGILYNDVPMRFDLTTNELVILDYTKNFPIKLITSRLDYFVIDSSRFINAANYYGIPLPQTTDFYQVLYNNRSTVVARKEKQLILSSKLDENDSHYIEFDWYYIYANDKLYKVDNEKSVLNAFEEKKTDLKKFIKANDISFKKNFENAVVQTTAYYDQLKK